MARLRLLAVISAIHIISALTHMLNDPSAPPGFIVDSSCSPQQQQQIFPLFQKTLDLLQAGSNAATSREGRKLFEFFFRSTDRKFVKQGFARLADAAVQSGSLSIIIGCADFDNSCHIYNDYAQFLRYPSLEEAGTTPRNNFIKFCPRFFTDIPLVDTNPCDRRELEMEIPGTSTFTQSQVFLHELFHIPYLVGPNVEVLLDTAKSTYDAHAITSPSQYGLSVPGIPQDKIQPRYSINNYIIFAKWAWILKQQAIFCASIPKLWGALDDGNPQNKVELRRLLGQPDDPSPEQVNRTDVPTYAAPAKESFFADATFTNFNITGSFYALASGLNFTGIQAQPQSDGTPLQVSIVWVSPVATASLPSNSS